MILNLTLSILISTIPIISYEFKTLLSFTWVLWAVSFIESYAEPSKFLLKSVSTNEVHKKLTDLEKMVKYFGYIILFFKTIFVVFPILILLGYMFRENIQVLIMLFISFVNENFYFIIYLFIPNCRPYSTHNLSILSKLVSQVFLKCLIFKAILEF